MQNSKEAYQESDAERPAEVLHPVSMSPADVEPLKKNEGVGDGGPSTEIPSTMLGAGPSTELRAGRADWGGYSLVGGINGPADVKKLTVAQLIQLADEIRQFIIETVGRTGGHLASSLGVVEITLALHYVFDFERDKLVWDVGHQCYRKSAGSSRSSAWGRHRAVVSVPCNSRKGVGDALQSQRAGHENHTPFPEVPGGHRLRRRADGHLRPQAADEPVAAGRGVAGKASGKSSLAGRVAGTHNRGSSILSNGD